MGKQKKSIKISILSHEYTVSCQENEIDGLFEAAAYLDQQMKTISDDGKVLGLDRCAIMAGLNISNTLLELKKSVEQEMKMKSRLQALNERLEKFVDSYVV